MVPVVPPEFWCDPEPDGAVDDPPNDLTVQLKVVLLWAPVVSVAVRVTL